MNELQRKSPVVLTDIHPSSFQHPGDIQYTKELKALPLLPKVQRWVIKVTSEDDYNRNALANCLRLGPTQGSHLHDLFCHAAHVLDVDPLPHLFLQNSSQINAFAAGVDDYSVTLTSGLVNALDEDEILAVMAHELGHIKCDHMLYKTMATIIGTTGAAVLDSMTLGLGNAALIPVQWALLKWSRMAEFSCDRAALLVVQDPKPVIRLLMMLAAGTKKYLPEFNIDAALEQAREYSQNEASILGKVALIKDELHLSHPVPALRCLHIHEYAEADEYKEILNGNYALKSLDGINPNQPTGAHQLCPNCGHSFLATKDECPSCFTWVG